MVELVKWLLVSSFLDKSLQIEEDVASRGRFKLTYGSAIK